MALLHDSPRLRVIGVDGQIGPLVEEAMDTLCAQGTIDGPACGSGRSLAWEETDEGRGWYRFHHHHFHVSLMGGRYRRASTSGRHECLIPGCPRLPMDAFVPERGPTGGPGF